MADIAQAFLRLRADGTGFKEEADATVKKSTAGLKAKVPLAVDDKEATVVVKRMKEQLTELSAKTYTAGLGLKDKDAQLRLQRFAVKLYDLGRKVADPELKLRGVARAETELLALGIQFDKLNGKTAKVRVETSKLGSTLSRLTPAWTGFLAAGLALGPALLPVLAAVTAAAIGAGAAIAGAGSAVGVFAVAAKGNLTEMQKALTKVKAAELAANTALAVSAKNRT